MALIARARAPDLWLPGRGQPAGLPCLDRRHALARGLDFAWLPIGPYAPNLVDGRLPRDFATAMQVGRFGPVAKFDGTNNTKIKWDYPILQAGTGPFTLAVLANPTSGASQEGLFGQRADSGGNWPQANLIVNLTAANAFQSGIVTLMTYNGGVTAVQATSSVDATPTWRWIAGRRDASASLTIWFDGVNVTSGSASGSPDVSHAGAEFALGGIGDFTSGYHYSQSIAMGLAWRRQLSDDEMAMLPHRAWELFQPPHVRRRPNEQIVAGRFAAGDWFQR